MSKYSGASATTEPNGAQRKAGKRRREYEEGYMKGNGKEGGRTRKVSRIESLRRKR
jgi:hypothetical protein